MKRFTFFIVICFMHVSHSLQSADEPLSFDNSSQEQRFKTLVEEVRCLVCQNQSLADSNADLAQDLREEIQRMILAEKEDEEIISFLVERYGDFVLYRPPWKMTTILLWLGPFMLFTLALISVYLRVNGKQGSDDEIVSEEQKKQISHLLQGNRENGTK